MSNNSEGYTDPMILKEAQKGIKVNGDGLVTGVKQPEYTREGKPIRTDTHGMVTGVGVGSSVATDLGMHEGMTVSRTDSGIESVSDKGLIIDGKGTVRNAEGGVRILGSEGAEKIIINGNGKTKEVYKQRDNDDNRESHSSIERQSYNLNKRLEDWRSDYETALSAPNKKMAEELGVDWGERENARKNQRKIAEEMDRRMGWSREEGSLIRAAYRTKYNEEHENTAVNNVIDSKQQKKDRRAQKPVGVSYAEPIGVTREEWEEYKNGGKNQVNSSKVNEAADRIEKQLRKIEETNQLTEAYNNIEPLPQSELPKREESNLSEDARRLLELSREALRWYYSKDKASVMSGNVSRDEREVRLADVRREVTEISKRLTDRFGGDEAAMTQSLLLPMVAEQMREVDDFIVLREINHKKPKDLTSEDKNRRSEIEERLVERYGIDVFSEKYRAIARLASTGNGREFFINEMANTLDAMGLWSEDKRGELERLVDQTGMFGANGGISVEEEQGGSPEDLVKVIKTEELSPDAGITASQTELNPGAEELTELDPAAGIKMPASTEELSSDAGITPESASTGKVIEAEEIDSLPDVNSVVSNNAGAGNVGGSASAARENDNLFNNFGGAPKEIRLEGQAAVDQNNLSENLEAKKREGLGERIRNGWNRLRNWVAGGDREARATAERTTGRITSFFGRAVESFRDSWLGRVFSRRVEQSDRELQRLAREAENFNGRNLTPGDIERINKWVDSVRGAYDDSRLKIEDVTRQYRANSWTANRLRQEFGY